MESYLLDWANLLLRWVHVITAIAWIGSSFYFVFLDSSLTPPEDDDLKKQGVSGELWAVHGGGFYHPVKFALSPPKLPAHLHWFYWESYSTWLTGFALFTVSYLWNARTYLIDASVKAWHPHAAIAVALAFLLVFWLAYDQICRRFGQRKNGDMIVGAGVAVLVCIAAWLACHWFAGRAAFLLVGAMMATTMSANVAHWIIPGQRKMVASIKAGAAVSSASGVASTVQKRRLAETDRAVQEVGKAQHQMFGLGPEAAARLDVDGHAIGGRQRHLRDRGDLEPGRAGRHRSR